MGVEKVAVENDFLVIYDQELVKKLLCKVVLVRRKIRI